MAKITENWLSTVDLGTYNITLYMVAPDLFNDPRPLAEDTDQGENAIIIAKSGVTGGYSIDNVLMKAAVLGADNQIGMAAGIIQFDLHEPLAFKLLDRVLTHTRRLGYATMQSARYVMKIEFLGRDSRTSRPTRYAGIHLYKLVISQIDASVTNKGTMYNIVASTSETIAAQESNTQATITIPGIRTVGDFAKNLETTLNQIYIPGLRGTADFDESSLPVKYEIEIDRVGARSPEILNQQDSLPLPADIVTGFWAGATDKSVTQFATSPDDIEKINEEIAPGTNLISYIRDKITVNSRTFIEWAASHARDKEKKYVPIIKVIPFTTIEPVPDGQTGEPVMTIKYVITAEKSWTVLDATYEGQQNILSDVNWQRVRFDDLPIFKKYAYLYSGENTEVLDFEINFNNMFTSARYPMDGKLYQETSQTKVPTLGETKTDNSGRSSSLSNTLARNNIGNYAYDNASSLTNTTTDTQTFGRPEAPLPSLGAFGQKYVDGILDQFPIPGAYVPRSTKTPARGSITYMEDVTPVTGQVYTESINYTFVHKNPAEIKLTQNTHPELARDTLNAIRMKEAHNRAGNGLQAELNIKGDPFWLGTPGAVLANTNNAAPADVNYALTDDGGDDSLAKYQHTGDILIALTTYNPDESSAEAGSRFNREMDMISSGIYRVIQVESRFSGGQFTQTLTCQRDRNTSVVTISDKLDQL